MKGKWVRKAHDSLSTHHTLGGQTVEHSHKEQNSSVRRQPVRTERRSAARQIQSKRTEFVCPSSTRHLSAFSERRLTARQIQSKRTEFVCPSSTLHFPLSAFGFWLLAFGFWRAGRRPSFHFRRIARRIDNRSILRYPIAIIPYPTWKSSISTTKPTRSTTKNSPTFWWALARIR